MHVLKIVAIHDHLGSIIAIISTRLSLLTRAI